METIITFVTGNRFKFEEISNLIKANVPGFKVIPAKIELTEIQADALEKVAIFKVTSVINQIKPPFFIEDSGFFVNALKGFPGVYSAYVMKVIGNKGILDLLGESTNRKAHFESVIAYIDEAYQIHTFKGINRGKVSDSVIGKSGFGFDPIFISDDIMSGKTFAELTMVEKNQISHRRRAMMKFIE